MNETQLRYAKLTQRIMGDLDELMPVVARLGDDPLGLLPEAMLNIALPDRPLDDGKIEEIRITAVGFDPESFDAAVARAAEQPSLGAGEAGAPDPDAVSRETPQAPDPAPAPAVTEEAAPAPPSAFEMGPSGPRLRSDAPVAAPVVSQEKPKPPRRSAEETKKLILAEVRQRPNQTVNQISERLGYDPGNGYIGALLREMLNEDPPKVSRRGNRGDYRWNFVMPRIQRPDS